MAMKLNWRGRQVQKKVERCEKAGIDATMTEAVMLSKAEHPWQNQTGTLERSIQIIDKARKEIGGIVGRWGTKGVEYGLWLELKDEWKWLRPAADQTYPNLKRNIRRCMSFGR